MNVSGLNKNFILAPCDNIENAYEYARLQQTKDDIIYDKGFMSAIDGEMENGQNIITICSTRTLLTYFGNNHPLEIIG